MKGEKREQGKTNDFSYKAEDDARYGVTQPDDGELHGFIMVIVILLCFLHL